MKNLLTSIIFISFATYVNAQRFRSFKTEQELKTYLISKLVWDPEPGFDNKKKDFLKRYFANAAPYVKNIIDTIAYTLKKERKQYILYKQPNSHRDDYLTPQLIQYYHQQIGIAIIETLGNSKALKRVDKFAQTFRYADIEIAKTMVKTDYWVFEKANDTALVLKPYYDSLLNEFIDKSRLFGLPVLYEGLTSIEDYERKTRNYFNTMIEKHLSGKADHFILSPGSFAILSLLLRWQQPGWVKERLFFNK
jgi:Domain of unknown function (DUF4838)